MLNEATLMGLVQDARRYRRLQILGCAVCGTPELEDGVVSRFSNLDKILDDDLKLHASRGEAGDSLTEVMVALRLALVKVSLAEFEGVRFGVDHQGELTARILPSPLQEALSEKAGREAAEAELVAWLQVQLDEERKRAMRFQVEKMDRASVDAWGVCAGLLRAITAIQDGNYRGEK